MGDRPARNEEQWVGHSSAFAQWGKEHTGLPLKALSGAFVTIGPMWKDSEPSPAKRLQLANDEESGMGGHGEARERVPQAGRCRENLPEELLPRYLARACSGRRSDGTGGEK